MADNETYSETYQFSEVAETMHAEALEIQERQDAACTENWPREEFKTFDESHDEYETHNSY